MTCSKATWIDTPRATARFLTGDSGRPAFLGFAAIGMTMQVMPAYAHERLGAGAITAGLAVTVGSLGTMFLPPGLGTVWPTKAAGRRVAMAGAILGVIGGIGHMVATNLLVLVLARLFLGAGEGALFTRVRRLDPGAHGTIAARQQVAGHFGLSMWTGLASGPMLGTAILSISTYRGVWIAASIVPMLAWVLVASTRPEGRVSSGGANIPPRAVPEGGMAARCIRRILQHRVRDRRGVSGAALRGSRLRRPEFRAYRVRHRVHDRPLPGQRICRSFRREAGIAVGLPDRGRRIGRLVSRPGGVARLRLDGIGGRRDFPC